MNWLGEESVPAPVGSDPDDREASGKEIGSPAAAGRDEQDEKDRVRMQGLRDPVYRGAFTTNQY